MHDNMANVTMTNNEENPRSREEDVGVQWQQSHLSEDGNILNEI